MKKEHLNHYFMPVKSLKEKKGIFKTALSATSPPKVIDIDKEKRTRLHTTRAPETLTVHFFYKQQKNLKEHKDQEQAMYDINVHHKTIMKYTRFINKNNIIDNCCKNDDMDKNRYEEIIKKGTTKPTQCTESDIQNGINQGHPITLSRRPTTRMGRI